VLSVIYINWLKSENATPKKTTYIIIIIKYIADIPKPIKAQILPAL
jgi:hypothetical protein